jgi:predicted metal-dependent hydrolase
MVSVSLDHPETPVYVLDFIMYHELLHKYLGLKTINGRNYGHTPEFREAERRYPKYKEAQAYLEKLGKKLV